MNKKRNFKKSVVDYFKRTITYKVCGLILLIAGLISIKMSNDMTFLIFAVILGVPLILIDDKFIK